MKLRKKTINRPEEGYNYSDCPYMNPNGRGCHALTSMLCRMPGAIPCGFYPPEKKRRAKIEAV